MSSPTSPQTSAPPLLEPPEARPLLSLCMMGCDDDYIPDFRYRLVTTVDFIARQLARLDALDQVEILFTDWASDTPMSETVLFSAESSRTCRFLYVSPKQIAQAGYRPDFLQPSVATNTAARRAAGEFIMQIGADTLLPLHALDYLLHLCRGEVDLPTDRAGTLFLIPRVHAPWQFVKRQPSVAEWERYLLVNSCYLPLGTPHNQASGGDTGAMLMHRRLWHGYRGFSEKLLGWGWNDCDLASRVCQTLPWMTLSGLGVLSIHMEHEPNVGKRAQIPALRRSNWGQVYPYTTQAEANDPNWGLADFELPVARARVRVAETAVAALHTVDTGALVPPEELANLPRELQDKNVLAAMARALGKLAEKRLVGKECLQDRAALALLGWYAAHRYPRRFLDVGIRQHEGAAAVVGALCPPVEIYAADLWDGEVEYVETPSAIAVGLEAAGHRGYLQFLNGDPQSSMARVARLMPGSRNVDLAYIRECCLGTGFAEFVALAFDHLAPGGALVFRAVSRQSTKRVWEHLQQQARLAARFAASDAFTGMAFAGAGETASAAAEPVELHGVGEKLAWGEVSPALLWQFVRALRHPGRPDQLLRRALRCFFRTGFTRPHA